MRPARGGSRRRALRRRYKATIIDWVQYLIARALEAVFLLLPWSWGHRIAVRVGDIARVLDRPSRKQRMARDIESAFPEFTDSQVSALIRENYRFMTASVLDSSRLVRLAASGARDGMIEVEGAEKIEGISKDTGIIFVSGHFGYWELLGSASTAAGYPVASLARPMRNPLLQVHVRDLRESTGQRILEKRGSMLYAIRALKGGQNLAFLIDQDARRDGVLVDFFGRPASTVTSVARISIYTGAPVVFAYARRIGGSDRFRIVIQDVIHPRKGADEREEVFRITQRFTKDLEDLVRKWPGEWLWLHNRWKTYPGKYRNRARAALKSSAGGEATRLRRGTESAPVAGSSLVTERVVVLAGGLGRRMRREEQGGAALSGDVARMAEQGLKGLIPMHGRPFLDYVVGSLLQAGLREICLVVPPDCEVLAGYARRTAKLTGAEITCAVQAEPRGTADALLAAEDFAGTGPFVMVNCDNLYPADALWRLARLEDRSCYVVAFESEALVREGNFAADRVRAFAAIVVGPGGELKQIVEKPPQPEVYARDGKLWVNMNLFRFTPEIFDSCRCIEPNPERGELELPTAVSHLVESGRVPVRVMLASGGVLDLTRRGDVASAERLLEGRELGF